MKERDDVYFLIVGKGTEYGKLEAWMQANTPKNIKLLSQLPKRDYDRLVAACDVGLIFLDKRFTIPNFPSRLLSYMQAKLPVISCTDANTDVGETVENGGFGWSCVSDDASAFVRCVDEALQSDLKAKGENGYAYLLENYTVERAYEIITGKEE